VLSLSVKRSFLFLLEFFDQLGEFAIRIAHEFGRAVEFAYLAKAQNKHAITLYDSVDSMCNDDHCGILESSIDQSLDFLFGYHINVGCRFVENYEFGFSEDGSANAKKLPLTRTQILSIFSYFLIQSFRISINHIL